MRSGLERRPSRRRKRVSNIGLSCPAVLPSRVPSELRQQVAATTEGQPGGLSTLTADLERQRHPARLDPRLCKQGVTGSSPVGSTTKNRPMTRRFFIRNGAALASRNGIVAGLTPI